MFGQAVHAFNKGQYQCAYDLLSSAIGSGSQDPRVYFFRGLATNALQGPGAGADDLQRGAELEANATRVVNVGRSLEKIQGCQRLEIEKYRRNARIQARAQQEMIQRARIEAAQQSGLTPLPPTPGEGVIADPFANGLIEGGRGAGTGDRTSRRSVRWRRQASRRSLRRSSRQEGRCGIG